MGTEQDETVSTHCPEVFDSDSALVSEAGGDCNCGDDSVCTRQGACEEERQRGFLVVLRQRHGSHPYPA